MTGKSLLVLFLALRAGSLQAKAPPPKKRPQPPVVVVERADAVSSASVQKPSDPPAQPQGKSEGADASASLVTQAMVDAALATLRHEPSIVAVQARAVEVARVDPDVVDEWRWRARTHAALPRLSTAATGSGDQELRDVIEGGKAPVSTSVDDRGTRLTVQASWELSRLVFEPDELAVAREGARLVELRARILEDVTHTYFERRRLQLELLLQQNADPLKRIQDESRVAELTAALDAATGGFFAAALEEDVP